MPIRIRSTSRCCGMQNLAAAVCRTWQQADWFAPVLITIDVVGKLTARPRLTWTTGLIFTSITLAFIGPTLVCGLLWMSFGSGLLILLGFARPAHDYRLLVSALCVLVPSIVIWAIDEPYWIMHSLWHIGSCQVVQRIYRGLHSS